MGITLAGSPRPTFPRITSPYTGPRDYSQTWRRRATPTAQTTASSLLKGHHGTWNLCPAGILPLGEGGSNSRKETSFTGL